MDDLGLNKWLEDTYGKTIDGRPLFNIVWSTGITEKRFGHFIDMLDDIFIREVKEVREVLKYPMAQDRWVLEVLVPVSEQQYGIELFTKTSYEPIYVFQDKDGNFLELNKFIVEVLLYFHFTGKSTPWHERYERLSQMVRNREAARRDMTKEILKDTMRSPYFLGVISDPKRIKRVAHKTRGGQL